jgi:hypothetical protein
MAKVNYIGRPVLFEQWVENLSAYSEEFLDGLVEMRSPENLRGEVLRTYEAEHVPSLPPEQVALIQDNLEQYRATQPEEGLPVLTTKVLIKRRCVLLGLEDNENLVADRLHVIDMLARLVGSNCGYAPEPFRFHVRLGKMNGGTNGSHASVIHGITDNVLPGRIMLGKIEAGLTTLDTGEKLVI